MVMAPPPMVRERRCGQAWAITNKQLSLNQFAFGVSWIGGRVRCCKWRQPFANDQRDSELGGNSSLQYVKDRRLGQWTLASHRHLWGGRGERGRGNIELNKVLVTIPFCSHQVTFCDGK